MKAMKKAIYLLTTLLAVVLAVGIFTPSLTAIAEDTRTEVSEFVMTSDIKLEYGGALPTAPNFTFTKGGEAHVSGSMGRWFKKDGEEWVAYNASTVSDGTYYFRTQLRIDGAKGTTHKFASEISVTVDGKKWEHADIGVYDTYSYTFISSPEYTVEWKEIPLKFGDSYSYDVTKAFIGSEIKSFSVAAGVVGGVPPYKFTKTKGHDWIVVSEDGQISGTPDKVADESDLVVRVTDAKGNYKEITIWVTAVVPDPADREVVKKFTATSDLDIRYGGAVKQYYNYVVTEGSEAHIADSMGRWFKKDGEEWKNYNEQTFGEGTYYFQTQLRIDDKNGALYKLAEDVEVTIDGKKWEYNGAVGIYDTYSYVFVRSPEFEVVKPDVTELIFWDKAEFDIPVNYVGVAIEGYDLKTAVEGGLAPYKFSKKFGPAWLMVNNDGIVSGTPTEADDYHGSAEFAVTDFLGTTKTIYVNVGMTYPAPENRENVSEIVATSDMGTPVGGGEVKNLSFTIENDVVARFVGGSARGWYVKQNDQWVKFEGETFITGTFRYQNDIAVDGDYGNEYKFADEITVTVDGVAWTVSNLVIENNKSTATVTSPEYECHVHEFELKKDADKHWEECYCGDIVNEKAHFGGEATCTEKAICEVCETVYGETTPHAYSEATCLKKATCADCGAETGELAAHAYGEATCLKKATCSVCGVETGELAAHKDADKDELCDLCGAEVPKSGLSGGAIAGIVIGGVVVLGVGGFALIWFVIKKKSFADLIAIFKK